MNDSEWGGLHLTPAERLDEGLRSVSGWAAAGHYGCKAVLIELARLREENKRLRLEVERLRAALEDVIESWSVHNAAVAAARALGHDNVKELAEGAAKSADEIQRLRAENHILLDRLSGEQATSDTLRQQMEVMAYNRGVAEEAAGAHIERLRREIERLTAENKRLTKVQP